MKAEERKTEKESTQKSVEDIQNGKESTRNGYGDRDPEDMPDGKKK
ncbi:MAG: hypothetical protein WBG46_13450 [Nonlabens sp.]